jgi:hypothetical protein
MEEQHPAPCDDYRWIVKKSFLPDGTSSPVVTVAGSSLMHTRVALICFAALHVHAEEDLQTHLPFAPFLCLFSLFLDSIVTPLPEWSTGSIVQDILSFLFGLLLQ